MKTRATRTDILWGEAVTLRVLTLLALAASDHVADYVSCRCDACAVRSFLHLVLC